MNCFKALAFVGLLASLIANAGEPRQFFGKWEEKHKEGSLVVEFTADKISLSQLDTAGKLMGPPLTNDVSYQKLGSAGGKESFGVNFKTADGKPSGGIMVIVSDHDHIIMDFPGQGAHPLERLKPRPN